MTTRVLCPACSGTGLGSCSVHIDYENGLSETRNGVCGTCAGQGDIEPRRAEDVARGRAHRLEREANDEGLREAAHRLGISPAWLSRLERGLERWPEDDER